MAPTKQNEYASAPPVYPPPPVTGFPVNSAPQQTQAPGNWSTGLCDCFEDVGNCCMTFCCPCITFGQTADIVDRGSPSCGASGALYALICFFTGCQCLYACTYRTKLRGIYYLPEGACPDCIIHCCCHTCALCQEYRELKNRGFDMAIGWHANVERNGGHGIAQAPMVQGGMMR